MFLLNGNILPEGVPFTDAEGNQYPANWLNLSTEEEKTNAGITWVANQISADDKFYWNGDINNPKALDDKEETDLEGNTFTTKGLKSNFVAQVKDTAGKLLAQTDWMVIRKVERNVDIPSEIAIKRTQIVTEANRLEADINASTTVEGLIEVLNGQNWGN